MNSENKPKSPPKRSFRIWILTLWILCLLPFVTIAALIFIASQNDLPDTVALANPQTNLATEIISADGKLLGKYFLENRTNAEFDQLSPYLVEALIATEDERFRKHSGVDAYAIPRVVMGVVTGQSSKGGGSTISQQLAKLLFPREDLNTLQLVMRKFEEWIIATRLERQYTKEEIITLYLNKFDWIHNAVGINSAASVYFDKTPADLKIEEAAVLVGMAKNPSLYDPLRRPENAVGRRNVVLYQMQRNNYISPAEYDSLKHLPLELNYQEVDHKVGLAPYFREVLRGELKQMLASKDEQGNYIYAKADGKPYNIYSDGLRVYTTIDSRMQRYAENAVREHLANELQDDFWKDISRYKNPPFSNDLSAGEVKQVENAAMRRSVRYRVLSGEECPNCHRRVNIEPIREDGEELYHCTAADCGEKWNKVPADSIEHIFRTKKYPMTVFSWEGDVDTMMTPMDSILYYKSFLQAGLVSLDPSTGFVKAWVGGIDYNHFKYDHVKQGKRQVGSTFKPFVYATAIREGYSPCYEIPKTPTTFHAGTFNLMQDYTPQDPDRDYGYMVSLKWGLANSINTVTAWVMKQFGPSSIIKLAKDLGIESPMQPVVSQCFGVADLSLMEITSANATFANKGVHIAPIYITRIEDKKGHAIYQMQPKTNEALDAKTAYIMLNLMQGVVDGVYNKHQNKTLGTAIRLRYDSPQRGYDGFSRDISIAGKTGTTQNQSDGWFIGLTPDLVTGVWVGAEDRSVHFRTLSKGMGTNMALPIWGYYMKQVYQDSTLQISKGPFEKPEGIEIQLNCDDFRKNQNPFESQNGTINW